MELRHLRYLVAVSEEQSFTRAAARLHMSQPPLSSQIRRLETELGVALLVRTRRGVRPTTAGQVLIDEARSALAGLDQAVHAVQRIGSGTVGRLVIGFVPSASNRALPPILRRFRVGAPEVEMFLRELRPDDLLERLRHGRVDLGLLYLPFEDEALEWTVVSEERLVAALPAAHPLVGRRPLHLRALHEEPFILPARHGMPGLHARVVDACRQAGFAPRPVQKDVWLMQTVINLVASGIGVALVPESVEDLGRSGVAYLPIHGGAHEVQLALAWRRDARGPLLDRFIAHAAG